MSNHTEINSKPKISDAISQIIAIVLLLLLLLPLGLKAGFMEIFVQNQVGLVGLGSIQVLKNDGFICGLIFGLYYLTLLPRIWRLLAILPGRRPRCPRSANPVCALNLGSDSYLVGHCHDPGCAGSLRDPLEMGHQGHRQGVWRSR